MAQRRASTPGGVAGGVPASSRSSRSRHEGTSPVIGRMHFVGIGGIGMSGIAEVLHKLGYSVQGIDIAEFANVYRLREAGIPVADRP